ncbi:MAG: hypothetical protein CVT82_06725 [Alphaproteobacteria bacterium HGW-Alphaproteobacteria-4]|nr:MAG: hypothetical protein CVT82_06725 [Alphaproteobacteria bacterium HGW-Alphaproteobacteria-4]
MNIAVATNHPVDEYGFPISGELEGIDRAGITEVSLQLLHSYGVTMPQVVENAGHALARLACRRFFGGDVSGKSLVVLAGNGNVGAAVLTAARRLLIWGASVRLVSARTQRASLGLAARQLAVLARLGIAVQDPPADAPDLIIDGLTGYDPDALPDGRCGKLIEWANATRAPVLAYESPAGAFSRRHGITAIRATATLMVGMPKTPLMAPAAATQVGALYLADISIPAGLWQGLAHPLHAPCYARGDILRVLRPGEMV